MGKLTVDIIEDNFSSKFSTAKELSILLGVDSFTYMISDAGKKSRLLKSFALETSNTNSASIIRELENIFKLEKSLKSAFNSISLGFENEYSVLIPAVLYQEKQRNTYLEHLMPVTAEMAIFTNDLHQQKIKNVFAVDSALLTFFEKYLPGFHILHFSAILVKALEQHTQSQSEFQMYMYLRPKSIRILLFNGDEIQYNSAFNYTTAKDVLYYVMLVLKQHKLDNNQVPLFLLGQLLEESEVYRLLYRYIRNLHFFEGKASCTPGLKLSKRPSWFFFDMLSI